MILLLCINIANASGTLAARRYKDDIPEEVKGRRLSEIIDLQHKNSIIKNNSEIGTTHIVLIEGTSKKSELDAKGRNDQNKIVIFPIEILQKRSIC